MLEVGPEHLWSCRSPVSLPLPVLHVLARCPGSAGLCPLSPAGLQSCGSHPRGWWGFCSVTLLLFRCGDQHFTPSPHPCRGCLRPNSRAGLHGPFLTLTLLPAGLGP